MRVAMDWSHQEKKFAVFDGQKVRKRKPKLTKGDQVFVENIPQKYARQWLENSVEIYRCQPTETAKYRTELGIEKADEIDAIIIWELAEAHPEKFRHWTGDPVLTTLYKAFKEAQQSRVRQSNRVWAKEEPIAREILTDLEAIENKIKKAMKKELEEYRIWSWLKQIKGIGVAIAAGLVAFIDKLGIENIPTVSCLWHYFGVHVEGGKAVNPAKGTTITYNPAAKALVLGTLADSFVRKRTSVYREIYDDEKEKQLAKEYKRGELAKHWRGYKEKDTHLLRNHAHKRARRKMVKLFLSHLWIIWRQLERLDTRPPFVHETLRQKNYIQPPCIPEELRPFKPFKEAD